MNVTDQHEFMLTRGEWKRLHGQIQENKKLTGGDLKAKIEVGPEVILIRFESLEATVEWKFRFL